MKASHHPQHLWIPARSRTGAIGIRALTCSDGCGGFVGNRPTDARKRGEMNHLIEGGAIAKLALVDNHIVRIDRCVRERGGTASRQRLAETVQALPATLG